MGPVRPEDEETVAHVRSTDAETVAQRSEDWTNPSLERPHHPREGDLTEPGVELGPEIARGGMAAVRLGRQRNLGRAVAVKTIAPNHPEDVTHLLREARLMSRLEHPNILPVHEIFVQEDGTPQVVLKLIEGETWAELMRDPKKVREGYGAEDLLEWNLSVLGHVCRAVEFAHSHGVIHRDIKPTNVMVGKFGEVYLLDWGIAQETRESDTGVGALPDDQIAGTSAYMAPEQFEGGATIGPWTDIYLLGATLYHVLSGKQPHKGKSRMQRTADMIDRIHEYPPLPGGVAEELREIVDKAMQLEIGDRYDTAADFRRALAEFSTHRVANRLAARGDEERKLAQEASARSDEPATLRHLVAAEMAYNTALSEWKDCQSAVRGQSELAVMRIEHALASGEPRHALTLVEAHGVEGELRERVEATVRQMEGEEARLRKLAADSDTVIGHRVRGIGGALVVGVFLVFWTWSAFDPPHTVYPLAGFTAVAFVLMLLGVGPSMRRLLKTRLNRTVFAINVFLMTLTIAWCLGGAAIGLSVRQVLVGMLALWSLAASGIAGTVHPIGLLTPAAFAIGFVVACVDPMLTGWAMLGAGLVALLNQLYLNRYVTGRKDIAAGASAETPEPD